MKRTFVAFILFLAICIPGFCQESHFKSLIDASDDIVHIKVILPQEGPGVRGEAGVTHYNTLCEVARVYKGKLKAGEKISISYYRFEFIHEVSGKLKRNPEKLKFQKNKEYIVFLSKRPKEQWQKNPVFDLTDRWLGVQKYDIHMEHRLNEFKDLYPKMME